MRLRNRRIVLGVTGSIAAYKALDVVRRLKKEGADVWVVMTRNGQEFVTPLSFQTLSGHPVATGTFEPNPDPLRHINLAEDSDLLAIVPATANSISKAASGIGDDLLSTIILATTKPIVFAPAMHEQMWHNPIIKQNVARLKNLGFQFIEPDRGPLASSPLASSTLASGSIGEGRLAPVEKIVDTISSLLTKKASWTKRTVVVTAGRTEESVDPIRVITNRSSGRMGIELARALKNRGALVKLIVGKVSVEPPAGIDVLRVASSAEMLRAVEKTLPPTGMLIMAAAVADFRPASSAPSKIKAKEIALVLKKTDDIVARIGRNKGKKILVGFSLETEDGISRATTKLKSKNLDLVIANPLESLESETSQATLIFKNRPVKPLPRLSKPELAEVIVDELEALMTRNG
jgi:phosphopantothenoylcysteine decarboxylase/phosphopantothenate--cysteine ligase